MATTRVVVQPRSHKIRELDIQQDELREQAPDGNHGRLTVRRLPDDVEGITLQEPARERSEAGMVVNDQHGARHIQIVAELHHERIGAHPTLAVAQLQPGGSKTECGRALIWNGLPVYETDNRPRVRDGYSRLRTRGHSSELSPSEKELPASSQISGSGRTRADFHGLDDVVSETAVCQERCAFVGRTALLSGGGGI